MSSPTAPRAPALGPAGCLAIVLAAALLTETLARFVFSSEPLLLLRRSLVAIPLLTAIVTATYTGRASAIAAGVAGAAYAAYFFVAHGTAPAFGDRALLGSVVGLLGAGTAGLVGHLKTRSDRAAAVALQEQRERARLLEDANRELHAANAALRDFTHVVAHDLRAPVRGIDRMLGMLAEDRAPQMGAEERAQLERARSETSRLHDLLETLLEYARVTRLDLADLRPVRVADILESPACQARFAALAQERRATILPPARDAPAVLADPGSLALILGNLVVNAIKHGNAEEPRVRVAVAPAPIETASDDGAWVEILVEDNGSGFSPETLRRIGDVLAGRESSAGVGRSGFGLLLVTRAVERLAGRLTFGRSADGGARVRIALLAPPRPGAPPPDGAASTPRETGGAADDAPNWPARQRRSGRAGATRSQGGTA